MGVAVDWMLQVTRHVSPLLLLLPACYMYS